LIILVFLIGISCFADGNGIRNILIEAVRPGLEICVDRGTGAIYVVGETLDVTVRSELDGYLTVYDFATDGHVQRIFPNQHYQDNWIDSDVDYTIPGNLLPFVFRVGPPEGEELLLAIVTSAPFELLPEGSYDFSDILPLILLGNLATAETITGSLGIVPKDVQVAVDMTYFTVSTTSGTDHEPARSIEVTSPTAQAAWEADSEETIRWNSENVGATVRIEYTTDSALSWFTILAGTENDGAQIWAIPDDIGSKACRVRITSVEYPSVSNTSETFTIEPTSPPAPEPERTLTITSPSVSNVWTAGTTQTIRWTSANAGTTVRVDYSTDGASTWQPITTSTSNDGTFSWSIPSTIDSARCKIRITSGTYLDTSGVSSMFTIEPEPERTLAVTSPSGSSVWIAGTTQTIRWTSTNAGTTVRADYSVDAGSTWITISSTTSNDGGLSWSIPATIDSTQCKVRVASRAYPVASCTSSTFTIKSAEADTGEVYALFVAISDYKSSVNDLDHPVSQNVVTLIREAIDPWIDHVRVLNDRQATRAGILNAIDTFLGQAGPNDTVYFHFVGHGTQVNDLSGDESDNFDEAIVPYDEIVITDDEIDDLFQALSAKRAILVFESCHSGTINRGLNAFTVYDPALTRDIEREGGTMLDDLGSAGTRDPDSPSLLYMVACGPDQFAKYDDAEDGVTVFALFMSLALTEYAEMADEDANKWVSFQEAFDLASRSLSKWVEENTDDEQEPMIVDQINAPVNVLEVEK